jgi:glycosyltransferase involved in cell wall biosynthesis
VLLLLLLGGGVYNYLKIDCLGQDWSMKKEIDRPIRVMRIIARMNVGGPAVQVSGLMRGLNREEFDHRLFTGYCSSNELDFLDTTATDIEATRIEGFGRRISLRGDLFAFFKLVKEIRNFKPHIIHTHTSKAGLLGRLASILSLQPSIRVHTFHGHLLTGYFGSLKRSLVVFAEKCLALITQQLLSVGNKVREDLLEVGIGKREKFSLMPPGLVISQLPLKVESRLALGLSKDKLQCAFIGRITQIKRPDRFLDVARELKKRGVALDFFIAGDGDLLDNCRKKVIEEDLPITLLGWQSDIERVLSAADIVCLTSDNEGMPLSLIQAGMAGLPVVTTNVGSVSEVVLDGVTGFVTKRNVQEIADALEKLVNNTPLQQSFGAAAKEFTMMNFGVQRLVSDHEKLYRNLIASRANF